VMRRPRGRPAISGHETSLDEVRDLIARAAGQPCPTLDMMAEAIGANRDCAERAIELLRGAGQLQVRRSSRVKRGGFKRRLRVLVDGEWSPWTAWTRREVRAQQACPAHAEAVLSRGRYD